VVGGVLATVILFLTSVWLLRNVCFAKPGSLNTQTDDEGGETHYLQQDRLKQPTSESEYKSFRHDIDNSVDD